MWRPDRKSSVLFSARARRLLLEDLRLKQYVVVLVFIVIIVVLYEIDKWI